MRSILILSIISNSLLVSVLVFALHNSKREKFFGTDTYSNNAIHEWAASVLKREFPNDQSGYYDLCNSKSMYIISKDGFIYDSSQVSGKFQIGPWLPKPDRYPVGLSFEEYSPDAVNACAIMLSGAEW